MLTSINIENVKKLKRYHTNNMNTRGCLFTDNKYIYKVFDKKMSDESIELLEELSEKKYDFLVTPVHLIEDNGEVIGYSTIDKKQKTMYNRRHRSIELRKKDLLKAFDLIETIEEHGMIYYDFHPGNVLVDSDFENLTLCDLDTLKKITKKEQKKEHYVEGFKLLLGYYYDLSVAEAKYAIDNGGNVQYDEDGTFKDCLNNIGKKVFKKKVKKLGFINTKNYRSHRADVKYVLEDRYKGGYIRD